MQKPTTREEISALFQTPEFARDMAIYLIGIGQILVPTMTPEEFDAFFGAKPMTPAEQAEYEQAIEQGKKLSEK